MGIIANQTLHMAGAVTAAAGDKAARFVQMCDALGVPLISLVDTRDHGGPEAERTGVLRHASRLLVATARLTVPLIGWSCAAGTVSARRPCLGAAQGAAGDRSVAVGSHGSHGSGGAVRLAMGKELDAIPDPAQRESQFRAATAAYREHVTAFNAARVFEIDDVIDPSGPGVISRLFATASARPSGRHIDTW